MSIVLFFIYFLYLCSMFPKSTHQTFSTKLFRHCQSHPRLSKEKFSETDFKISHYAGKVSLCWSNFAFIIYWNFTCINFFNDILLSCRLLTIQIAFWTKTVTMLLLNIAIYWLLPNVPLYAIFSLFFQRNLLDHHTSFLQ